MNLIREEVIAGLKSAIATVVFEKADGFERVMRCTLMENFLPEKTKETSKKKSRPVNDDVVAVFDLDKESWRSFRLDSVTKITYATARRCGV